MDENIVDALEAGDIEDMDEDAESMFSNDLEEDEDEDEDEDDETRLIGDE